MQSGMCRPVRSPDSWPIPSFRARIGADQVWRWCTGWVPSMSCTACDTGPKIFRVLPQSGPDVLCKTPHLDVPRNMGCPCRCHVQYLLTVCIHLAGQ